MVPIVLVHGLIGTLRETRFAGSIAIDLRGYGQNADDPAEAVNLPAQAAHVIGQLEAMGVDRYHLVGHSVGGAVAALVADAQPERVVSVVSIEGNFTLDDAFMASRIAAMELAEVEALLNGYRADVAGWLAAKGIATGETEIALARLWLANQPARTLLAQARSVMVTTTGPAWDALLGRVFSADRRFHLIAGARSRGGWPVPPWVVQNAQSFSLIDGAGHFPMIEDPPGFERLLLQVVLAANPGRAAGG